MCKFFWQIFKFEFWSKLWIGKEFVVFYGDEILNAMKNKHISRVTET